MNLSLPQQDRRAGERRPAGDRVRIECRRGDGPGPNLALAVLDVSQTGLRLSLNEPVEPGEQFRLSLQIVGEPLPIRVVGTVRWRLGGDGPSVAGFELGRRLRKTDLSNLIAATSA